MYKIIGTTNGYIAARDTMFREKTEIVISTELTLKQAYKELLDIYNNLFDRDVTNWGIAVILSRGHNGAVRTHSDGTRELNYDSRTFKIIDDGNL